MVCNYLTLIPLNICRIKLEEHKRLPNGVMELWKRVEREQNKIISVRFPVHSSVATVRFGSVRKPFWLNPEPNLRFSSGKCLNLKLNLEEPVQEVRFRFRQGLNLNRTLKIINYSKTP